MVAKGLCQQDRKMKLLKLLLLPPAFGMATDFSDFSKAFRESVPSYPGQAGNRNGSNHGQPRGEPAEVSQLPVGGGAPASLSSGSESALAGIAQVRQAPQGVTKHFKKTRNSINSK